jgi:hypothetical protein
VRIKNVGSAHDEGYYVPDGGYSRLSNLSILSVPDEGYSRLSNLSILSVPDGGYYVPDEGYSRNASWALPTFLIRTVINLYQMNFDKYLIKERTGHLENVYFQNQFCTLFLMQCITCPCIYTE